MTSSNYLKQAREAAGKTAKEVCEFMGRSSVYYRDLEGGQRPLCAAVTPRDAKDLMLFLGKDSVIFLMLLTEEETRRRVWMQYMKSAYEEGPRSAMEAL